MDKRFGELKTVVAPLVDYAMKNLPDGYSKDQAFCRFQESVWWFEKSINDEANTKAKENVETNKAG